MSFSELIVLMAIALILFGPEDLPDVARAVGRVVHEVKKIASDMTREFQDVAKAPSNILEKAFEDTVKKPSPTNVSKEESANSSDSPEKSTGDASSSNEAADQEEIITEEILTYEEDPLAELPEEMVSYEKKGASR